MLITPIRRLLTVAAFLSAASFSATAVNAADEGAPAGLDGTWKLVAVELDGEERPLEDEVRWVIQKDKVLYGGELLALATSYPASSPKGIDLAFQEPKQDYEGIYVVKNDGLKVCLNTRTIGPKERPAEFSTKTKPNLRIFIFQRILPPDDGPGPVKGFVGMALALENGGLDVAIGSVLEKSPAEKAGLRAGDIILSVGNDPARDLQATVNAIRGKTPGSELKIRVLREGVEKDIAVKVGQFPFSLLGLLG